MRNQKVRCRRKTVKTKQKIVKEQKQECCDTWPFWKLMWPFFRNMAGIELPQDPAVSLLEIYPKDSTSETLLSTMSTAALLIIEIENSMNVYQYVNR